MAKTKLSIQNEIRSDPCRQFRRMLKDKQYDEEKNQVFTNKLLAYWLGISESAAAYKMSGKTHFSVRDIRIIMLHIPFTKDEKAAIF